MTKPPDSAGGSPTTPTVPPTIPARTHSSPFDIWRHFDCNRRRREHAEQKRLHPWTPAPPSTFGLEPAELEREWARLTEADWPRGEIVRILVEPR